ncbi:MAG: hypothetical protein AAF903_09905 [Pseudomonadota bacterium]
MPAVDFFFFLAGFFAVVFLVFFTGFFLAATVFVVLFFVVVLLVVVFLVEAFFTGALAVFEEALVATFFLLEEDLAVFFAPLPGLARQKAFTRAPSERVNAATWEHRLLEVQALFDKPLQTDCACAGALVKAVNDSTKANTVATRTMVDLKNVIDISLVKKWSMQFESLFKRVA